MRPGVKISCLLPAHTHTWDTGPLQASVRLGPPRYTNREGLEQFPTGSLPVVSQIVLAQLTLMGQPLIENHSDSKPDAAAFEGALHVQQRCNGTAG